MLQLEEALERILSEITPFPAENVRLAEACGRYIAEPVSAPMDLPAFDSSAMDGYAVRAEDVARASKAHPIRLRVEGQIAAGEVATGEVHPAGCIRVFTGSMLPPNANAVVMQEDTLPDSARPGEILVTDAVKPWENVRFRGEDVKPDDLLLRAGDRITAARVALLGALGIETVPVGRAPTVALIATGSELREGGRALAPGQIYESNRAALAALAQAAGARVRIFPLIPDSLEATRSALTSAFRETDAVITSGGVSVGAFDFVKHAVEALDGQLSFWKVAIKPGKPFVFGRCGGKPFFGLPGNPVSAFVTFLLLVRPALLRMQSSAATGLSSHPGILSEALVNRGDRRHFMRVHVDAAANVRPAGVQGSHRLRSLADANGLIDVPAETVLPQGEQVAVLRWEI